MTEKIVDRDVKLQTNKQILFSLLNSSENLLQGSIATDKDSRSSFQDKPLPDKVRESVIRFDPSVDEDDYCSDEDDPDKVSN